LVVVVASRSSRELWRVILSPFIFSIIPKAVDTAIDLAGATLGVTCGGRAASA
jgi:hypothetical protein